MNIIGDKLGVWLATIIVALLTIFSDKILERIRFALMNVVHAQLVNMLRWLCVRSAERCEGKDNCAADKEG